MEFLTLTGVALIIFVLFFIISNFQGQSTHDLRIRLGAQDVCDTFSVAFNAAYTGGSGFSAHVTLPSVLNSGELYNLSVGNRTAAIAYDRGVVFCRLISNAHSITNPVPIGPITLMNQGGVIYVS